MQFQQRNNDKGKKTVQTLKMVSARLILHSATIGTSFSFICFPRLTLSDGHRGHPLAGGRGW